MVQAYGHLAQEDAAGRGSKGLKLRLPHCAASLWCRYMATLLKKALLDEKAKVPSIEGWEDSSVGAILQTILKHMLIILGPTKRLNELVRGSAPP